MKKSIRKTLFAMALFGAAAALSTNALAQEWPLAGGDYWTVTGIDTKDGGDYKYAQWLASEWKKNSEFAVSKGWPKGYKVFYNVHNRKGEPDIYLVRIFERMPTSAEGEARYQEYMEWAKKSEEQMQSESGNRAEYREVMSTVLLNEALFRD